MDLSEATPLADVRSSGEARGVCPVAAEMSLREPPRELGEQRRPKGIALRRAARDEPQLLA